MLFFSPKLYPNLYHIAWSKNTLVCNQGIKSSEDRWNWAITIRLMRSTDFIASSMHTSTPRILLYGLYTTLDLILSREDLGVRSHPIMVIFGRVLCLSKLKLSSGFSLRENPD